MGGPVVTSPEATLKTVCRRFLGLASASASASAAFEGFDAVIAAGGGGGTENRARS